jgi:hypothetical protein
MRVKKAATFRKNKTCPATEILLAFHHAETANRDARKISSHLEKCEFCSAELYFLGKYPPTTEIDEKSNQLTEMPPALKQLAEALLGGKQTEFRLLAELFKNREIAVLKKA